MSSNTIYIECPVESCEWATQAAYATKYNYCPVCGIDIEEGPESRKVYLAGPIQHSDTGGHGWRDALVNEWPDRFTWLNPLNEIDAPVQDLKPSEDHMTVVGSDKGILCEADVLLVGWNHRVRSRGTMSEIILAKEVYDIPVALWNRTQAHPDELSFWVHDYADIISEDLLEVLEWLETQTL